MASSIISKMRCVFWGLMYETTRKRVHKSKRCVLFMTFRPSQRTLYIARRYCVHQALISVYQPSGSGYLIITQSKHMIID